jgi:hypothetical protein
VMVAPQLVTLTEKSPVLSSYTPTIFLPAALAGPRAAAHAHAHSSVRSSGALAAMISQRRRGVAVRAPLRPKKDDGRRQKLNRRDD